MTSLLRGSPSRVSLSSLVFLTLTFVFGLQMLRLLMVELVFYLRDAKDASSPMVGITALLLFLTVFLMPLARRFLGWRATFILASGGLGVTRIAEQFVSAPAAEFALSMIATGLFLWFIPISLQYLLVDKRGGGTLWGLGLVLGISADTAIKGVFGTLDLYWQTGVGADVVAIVLAVIQLILLWYLAREEEPMELASPTFASSLYLVALGSALLVEFFLFQNIGQQTVLTGWPQPAAFAWISAANFASIIVVVAVAKLDRPIPWPIQGAIGMLLVLAVIDEQSGGLAAAIAFLGPVAVAFFLMNSVRSMGALAGRPSATGVVSGTGVGMIVFLALIFIYFASFDIDLFIPRQAIPPIAAGIVALAGVVAGLSPHKTPSVVPMKWVIALPILLMVLPLVHFINWDEPTIAEGNGYPVRVMSYNLHQGVDIGGTLGMEALAQVIEKENPDILALQEVARGWVVAGSVDMLVWLSQRLGMDYVSGLAVDSVWGNAVLSRYPILSAENHLMPNNRDIRLDRGFISMEVDVGGGSTLRILATHLHAGTEEGIDRIPQVEEMLNYWNEVWDGTGSTILLGDLNAHPGDDEMVILSGKLKDAFDDSNAAPPGYTSRSDDPWQRIDYIWISPDLTARDFSISQSQASDHFPVAVTIER